MSLFDILFKTHSGLRWLVALVGVITLVKLLITWLGKRDFSRMDRGLTSGFVGLLDLQMLLGLSLILWFWLNTDSVALYQWEHGITNIIAIAVAHFGAKKWSTASGPVRARNTFLMFLLAIVLIGAAISRLPQGWPT